MAKPRPKRRDLNRVLAALSPSDYRRVESRLETAPFTRGQPLHEPDRPIPYIYFPRTGVASEVTRLSEGGTIEVATIGNEGLVGVSAFLSDSRTSMEVFVQIPGDAVRMKTERFLEEVRQVPALASLVGRYAYALLTQVGRSAACNRIHPIAQRCARWLLMSHDRVAGDQIALTHEYLAEMLGVRRATVTQVAGLLRRRRLIEYQRGTIRVVDRAGLEKASCECYGFIRSEHDRLIG